jgi:hypothetical protein
MKRLWMFALIAFPSLALAVTSETLPTYDFTYGVGQFPAPVAIACGADSLVFVADELAWTVHVFTASGVPVRVFPVGAKPAGMAVAPDGTVWVACAESCLVRAFTPAGAPVRTLYSPARGDTVSSFGYPRAVACLADGSLYVSCDYRDRILHFTSGGSFLNELGTVLGDNTRAFYTVPQLAVFPDGSLLFGVPNDGVVHHWSPEGAELPTFSGRVPASPGGVTVDAVTGQAWVGAWQMLIQYSAAGALVATIDQELGKWESPRELAADGHGHLHVITMSGIARFSANGSTPARHASWGAIKSRYR